MMPTVVRRLAGLAVAAVVLALLAAGCEAGPSKPAVVARAPPTGSPPTATSPTPTPTPSPTRTGPGPMTAAEVAWLSAVKRMHAKIDAAFAADVVYMTRAKMRSLSAALGECRRVLRRIGPPTARLRPVLGLVNKACGQFDRGAKCFLKAVRVSDAAGAVEAGTSAERVQRQAFSCGFAGHGDGTNTLVNGEAEAERIKLAAG